MAEISSSYLGRHRKFRTDHRKLTAAFLVIAFFVAIIVFWWLKLIGITVTGDALCSIDEHIHTQECYSEIVICGNEAASGDAQSPDASHIHTEECYEQLLVCTLTAHSHSAECFPNPEADKETVGDWLETIENVEITNNIPENLLGIALSQTGYEESRLNFEADDNGNKNGYTRYGEWYGSPYGKWNTMFISFCLHYSNINNASDLIASGSESMRLAWQEKGIYASAEEHTPQRGDIVFIDSDLNTASDTTAIVLSAENNGLVIILGDSNNKVETTHIEISDSILGYGLTSELSFARDTEYNTAETEAVTQETTTEHSPSDEALPLMLFSTPRANITYIDDLTSVVKAVTFRTTEGEIIDNTSTVYLGQTYIISMEFAEKNTGNEWIQFRHDEHHELHYQIPENIHCEAFKEWHPITAKTEDGTIEDVGEYFVDEQGRLTVIFHDDPETGECFGAKYSNVDFTIELNATVGSTQSGTSTEVIFNDEIKVNLNIDDGAGMTVEKNHGGYDSDNHTVEYTIRVEATHGVINDLVLDDQIWDSHYTLRDTIVVTDLDGNVLDPQPVISNHPHHSTGADEGFRLSGFPAFSAGEGFLITYKSQIYDELLSGEAVSMWNGLDSTGKSAGGDTVYVWAEDWLKVELEKMTKDGKQSVIEDENGNQISVIEWEVAIKKNNTNLQGTVIIDTLGEGLSYYTGKDILIKHYDEWGNKLQDTYLSWDNVTINGNSMSFPLPEGYTFDIFYYTIFEQLDEGEMKHYKNSVSATINGKYETTGGEADVVGFVPRLSKSSSGNDGEYVYFTIEADVPGVIKNWGHFYITDMSAFWSYNNNVGYLYVDNKPVDMEITAVTESGRTVTFTPYVEGGPVENTYILVAPAGGNQNHSFNICFNTSEPSFESSEWLIGEDSVLTITYKLPFDSKTGTEWTGELTGDKTIEDVLLEGYSLANEVYLNYTEVIIGSATSSYEYAPTITKDSVVYTNGVIDYKVVFHNTIPGSYGNSGYLNYSTMSAYFTDTFDEKLEYVPGSLTVTCYDPWRDNIWLNKYTYNGAVQGNTINLHMNQFIYTETNPEAATIGWSGLTSLSNLEAYYKWINSGGRYVFTYQLKLKDEYVYTTEENKFVLDNTSEIVWNGDETSGPAKDSAEFKTGLLDKQVVQESNKLLFDIHVNRNALDILKGTDTIIIDDTMTSNLSVYWETISLMYQDTDGSWVNFNSDESRYSYTVTYDQNLNKLTFVLPDELHIRIDYTTLITESGQVSVSNSVRVDGRAEVSDILDAVFKVEQHSGDASGSLHRLTLLKQDGSSGVRLPGITFYLYGPMGNPDAVIPDSVPESIDEEGYTIHYIDAYTTGDDGTVNIETQYLTFGGPYALVEAEVPEGYLPPEKPVYFYFYENDPDGLIQTVTTLIAVENYTFGYVLPETGGIGTTLPAIIGITLTAVPILYSILRCKRERRSLKRSP